MAKKKPKTLEEALQSLARRFRESGLSRVEFDAQELAKRERQHARDQRETTPARLRDLGVAVEIQRDGTADPRDVADALSLRHRDGKPVKLAALLVESGLADADDAARVCKSSAGKDLAAALRERWWRQRNMRTGPNRLMKNASLGNRERAGAGIEAPLDIDSE